MTVRRHVLLVFSLSALMPLFSLAQEEAAQPIFEPVAEEIADAAQDEVEAPSRPVVFSAAVDSEYNDNRDSSEEKAATLDTYLRPGVSLLLDSERALLDVRYAPAYRYRSNPARGARHSDFFHDFSLDSRLRPTSRLVLGLRERFNESDDPSIQSMETSLRRDALFYLNRASASVKTQLSPKSRLDLEARHSLKRYAANRYRLSGDEQSAVGNAALWYIFSRSFSMALMGAGEWFGYPKEESINRDFASTLGAMALRKRLTGTLTALATLGWKIMDYEDAALGGDSGPYGRVSLAGAPNTRFRTEVGLSHMLRDSDVYPYASQQYTGGDAMLEWDVLDELALGILGGYRTGVYDPERLPRAFVAAAGTGVPPEGEGSTDSSGGTEAATIGEAWLSYRFGTGKSLRLYQRYEVLDSELSDSFERNLTGLTLHMDF